MAKVSAVNKNDKRIKLSDKLYKKRQSLKKIIMDKKLPLEERFKAQQKLSQMPRNSYILFSLNVTLRPALVPFLVLKFATDFLNFVITGF